MDFRKVHIHIFIQNIPGGIHIKLLVATSEEWKIAGDVEKEYLYTLPLMVNFILFVFFLMSVNYLCNFKNLFC